MSHILACKSYAGVEAEGFNVERTIYAGTSRGGGWHR